jgi:membrane-bound ClpP family serine protease
MQLFYCSGAFVKRGFAGQFGTNLRATAATTIPNMVRGLVILMTLGYTALKPGFDVIGAGVIVGVVCFVLGFYSILTIPETHGRDLDFLEE